MPRSLREAEADGSGEPVCTPAPDAAVVAPPAIRHILAHGNAAAAPILRSLAAGARHERALQRKEGEGAQPQSPASIERFEGTGTVDVPTATIRAQPDEKAEKTGTLPMGATPKVHAVREGQWYLVDVDGGGQGWIHLMDLAVTSGGPADPVRTAVDVGDWLQVIPDAALRAGVDPKKVATSKGHKHAKGGLTQFDDDGTGAGKFSYRKQGADELAVAGAVGAGVLQSDVDAAVERIKTARAAVKQRYMITAGAGNDYSGLQTTPEYEQRGPAKDKKAWEKAHPKKKGEEAEPAPESEWQAGADQSVAFKKWLNLATTRPASIADPEDMNWKAFRRIFDWEGFPSAVQTYDQANITFGVGFAGLQAEELLQRILQKSPDAKAALHAAGLAQSGTQLIVVDPARKWRLRGTDAELYLRDNRELISLLVNVFQGVFQDPKDPAKVDTDMRQKVLDANWEQFAARTMSGMTAPPKGSDVDLWALKLHTRHAGNYVAIAKLNACSTIDQTVELIYESTSQTIADTIVLPDSWRKHGHDHMAKRRTAAPAPAP